MISKQIRQNFLKYFKNHHHTIVPSSPVAPLDDPTLLFINAGMNQFKDVFLGKAKRDYNRAASCQKCIRVGGKHNDLENVGHTSRHLTLFEMLGNFSFGNYFKKEAIEFAWEVVTQVFGFDPEKIWASVYQEDDEAFAYWEKYLPVKRIVRFGEKENFWQMGPTGPCGPCSELLFDKGDRYSKARNPIEDTEGERFFEFWNLVFMQFNREADGSLISLPQQSIDTGAGLERVVSLKMGVDSVFETDILKGLIEKLETICHKKYNPKDSQMAPCFHVIADHIRTLAFSIADGVQPSNTDRGYVLRKVLRRAVRYGRALDINTPFLAKLVPSLAELMDDYKELSLAKSRIEEIITIEEEAFIRTLQKGGNLLSKVVDTAHKEKRKIYGTEAFTLKDTYGFPLEEIQLIAKDAHLEIDLPSYYELEEEAKEKSKKAKKTHLQTVDKNLFADFAKSHSATTFVGYENFHTKTQVIGIVKDDHFVNSLHSDEEGIILLAKTPFYAEMGGQVGDTGMISSDLSQFEVTDTMSPYTGIIAHLGKMKKGVLKKEDPVVASIDEKRRKEIQNNHTATHLLHLYLQRLLGEHIKQAGSLVDYNRLRFDFNHHKSLTKEEIRIIESQINEKIRTDAHVKSYQLSFDEVQKKSDIKQFFGEKYGAIVRVIDIEESKELCGGTHTSSLGTIGFCKIIKESSIAKGVRRIEMVSGKYAEEWVYQKQDLIDEISDLLKIDSPKILEKTEELIEKNKELLNQSKDKRKQELLHLCDALVKKIETIHEIPVIVAEIGIELDEVPLFTDLILQKKHSLVLALGIKKEDKCFIFLRISDDLIQKNILANELIKEIAPIINGSGGGKKGSAQAGGKEPSQLQAAFLKLKEILKKTC